MSISIKQTKLLIVEGRDEELFFDAVFRDHLHIMDVQILAIGGKMRLGQNLKTLKKDAAFAAVVSLAVVRDADLTVPGASITAAAQAFAAVQGALTAPGVQLACPGAHGQWAVGPPRVGVFIMPNGVDDGMLETLCLLSVAASPEFPCLASYFACLQNYNVAPNNLDKARAHAWLASRTEPDKRLGEAAQAGYWPWAEQAFTSLWDFLKAM